jgi:hypothetical protein
LQRNSFRICFKKTMKKSRNYYLSFFAAFSLGLMTSCGGDDTGDPAPDPVAEMNFYSARISGNQNNTTAGSFFSSADGVVKSSEDAKNSASTIDFLYYHSSPQSGDPVAAANGATVASPADTKAMDIYNSSPNGLQFWAIRNATKFKRLSSDVTGFINLANGTEVAGVYTNSTAAEATAVTQLKANDMFAFMTVGGKHGVAKVNSVTVIAGTTNFTTEIQLDVKVEK